MILALTLLAAVPARAEKDAAIKAQEGNVDHWIEYYRNQQQPQPVAPAPPAAPPDAAANAGKEEEREKRKEER